MAALGWAFSHARFSLAPVVFGQQFDEAKRGLSAPGVKPGRLWRLGEEAAYAAALLADMGLIVTTIERYLTLALAAHERLQSLGRGGIEIIHGDGLDPPRVTGAIGGFDRILVNGLMGEVPQALAARLNSNGRLVGAMALDGLSRMFILTRKPDGALAHELGGPVKLPPIAPGVARAM